MRPRPELHETEIKADYYETETGTKSGLETTLVSTDHQTVIDPFFLFLCVSR